MVQKVRAGAKGASGCKRCKAQKVQKVQKARVQVQKVQKGAKGGPPFAPFAPLLAPCTTFCALHKGGMLEGFSGLTRCNREVGLLPREPTEVSPAS